ncbi:MAG: hypothetical protein ACD_3C00055G0001 [uncultured bacterium (gcode 4)]|uniref:ABC transporter domain-containing protein n=1 Tax=uncultured bacterium (gcode 4) TaxID=1234023 RepID=K2GDW2_9BACT|nr:MAG: hypothetical protein ACD_3C00055G0001 [uncultured bacterium (gcode 4)]
MKNPYLNLLVNSYRFSKNRKKHYILVLVLFTISNSLMLLQPFIFGQMLNSIQKWWDGLIRNFVILLIAYSLIPVVFWIFHWSWRLIEKTNSFFISKNYKENIFSTVTRLPFSWHADYHSWETINKINKSSKALSGFSEENFMYIQTIIEFVWSLIWIAVISWYLSLGLALSTVLVVWIIIQFDKKLVLQYEKVIEKDHKVAGLLQDYISNIRTVITLHLEDFAKTELVRKIMDMFGDSRKNFISIEIKWFTVSMCVWVLEFAVLLIYGFHTFRSTGTILVGNLVIIFQFLGRFMGTFYNFAWQYETVVRQNTEFMSARYIFEDFENLVSKKEYPNLEDWKNISIERLNFKYNKNKRIILKDVSFHLKRWERVAFIWESWGWKSTMLSIMKWLYETSDLQISVDGKIYPDSGILSDITTLIPQDPEIFENTIRYNVTFWMEVDEKSIMKSIGLSNFDVVLSRLGKGLDTNIKEKWVNLSGWEKQRLALARWLFSAEWRTIIILDEPTSSVDTINEMEIYENIFEEYSWKSIISSIHKLHLLPMFDKVYLFEKWEIIESWTFDEAMSNKWWKIKAMWDSYQKSHKNSDSLSWQWQNLESNQFLMQDKIYK